MGTAAKASSEGGIPKAYDPASVEDAVYRRWTEAKAFAPASKARSGRSFVVLMPPPNVTGKLHLGHAMANATEDAMARYHRMQGDATLFLPGTDHAGIATQVVVEKHLSEEGKTKEGLGREAFVQAVWEWKERYHSIITEQIRKLGVSCDWSRERFTLDEGLSRAVTRAFVQMHAEDLIYKGNRIVNWCPRCQTVLSDMEVVYREEPGKLWMIRYFVKAADKSVVVATTRPETLLGDTAVAVHPDDKRYKEFIGKMLILPIVNREIPVVADESIDMEFGTGAVKVTPAHDEADFAIAQRHSLPIITVIGKDGRMSRNTGKFAGLSVEQARENIIGYLDNIGNLEGERELPHNVASCQRCETRVEPFLSPQWFVRMRPLAERTQALLRKESLEFVPERFATVFGQWLENAHDWCVSRQLWWGHRIPAWYGPDDRVFVAETEAEALEAAHKHYRKKVSLRRDEDVLDTWFSSALWPFSTMGWPSRTEDLKRFFPSTVLETGYDIMFFWVVRMVFMSAYLLKRIPFKTVYMHGLVRDEFGRKMSKSIGNGIDPMDVIAQYGADALRLSLIAGHTPGNDVRFSMTRVESQRNFVNKLWNASRFIRMNIPSVRPYATLRPALERGADSLSAADRWILAECSALCRSVTESMDRHAYGEAVEALQEFIWNKFCDWYIEMAKVARSGRGKEASEQVLPYVLMTSLKLLHPFAPFVTEQIWSTFAPKELLCTAEWPTPSKKFDDPQLLSDMQAVLELIRAIRNVRTERSVPAHAFVDATVIVPQRARFVEAQKAFVGALSRVKELRIVKIADEAKSPNSVLVGDMELIVTLSDRELQAEDARKTAKLVAEKERFVAKLEAQLRNKDFLSKAKPSVLAQTKKRLEEEKTVLKKLKG